MIHVGLVDVLNKLGFSISGSSRDQHNFLFNVATGDIEKARSLFEKSALNVREIHGDISYHKFGVSVNSSTKRIVVPISSSLSVTRNLSSLFEELNNRESKELLPVEGQWVRWQGGVCPNCEDWMFYNGDILRCDCGRELRLTLEHE